MDFSIFWKICICECFDYSSFRESISDNEQKFNFYKYKICSHLSNRNNFCSVHLKCKEGKQEYKAMVSMTVISYKDFIALYCTDL